MHRCAASAPSPGASRRFVLTTFAAALAALPLGAARAQSARRFPRNALRGDMVFVAHPEVSLNGKPARLSPGSRVRDMANMNALPTALAGNRAVVLYTLDAMGLVKDVWILAPAEIERLWPRTPQEAATWRFDEATQIWSRP